MATMAVYDSDFEKRKNAFLLRLPGYRDSYSLSAGVARAVTIPAGAGAVKFYSKADFYAQANTVAAMPVGDVTDGTAPALNPAVRDLAGVSTLSLVSAVDCRVELEFFEVRR